MVKKAQNIAKKAKKAGKPYDEIWCAFDADPKGDNPSQLKNFNEAILLCNKLKFGTAYSHQAFEYWLILHFEDHQGGSMPRTDYDPKLNKYLAPFNLKYDGTSSKVVTPEIFEILFATVNHDKDGNPITRTELAINRAKKIYNNHGDHSNPASEESCTTVFRLVEMLLDLAKQY